MRHMDERVVFGQWIKRLRSERDLTQERLGEEVACAVQTIRALESGARRPSVAMAARLADVLRVPPAERDEFLKLARAKPAVADELSSADSASRPAHPVFHPPPALTALIGRAGELKELRDLLVVGRARLVTLLGPGGVGKSRLANQLAHDVAYQFAQGALWIPLSSAIQAESIPVLVAEAMGQTLQAAAQPAAQLRGLLADRTLLLVLDSFEHLLHASAGDMAVALVEEVLLHAPGVQVVVTSRERLRLAGERVFEVDGLRFPDPERLSGVEPDALARFDGVMLFLERARQVDRQFSLDASNAGDVARLCALLQGMPLGIELAASWVRLLSPGEIAKEIAHGLDLLVLADRTQAARHRSMRAVFDHSWMLLQPEERNGLARLSVCRGGFDRGAAREVAGVSLPLLARLVDKSLVRVVPAKDRATDTPAYRYELHSLLRQYLREKLNDSGEAQDVARRHASHFLEVAQQGASKLVESSRRHGLAMLEADQGNLRAALEWSLEQGNDPTLGLRLAAHLGRFWYLSEQWREGRDWLLKAVQSAGEDAAARALAYARLGEIQHALSEHSAASVAFAHALDLWRALDRPEDLAWTLVQAGSLASTVGDYSLASAYFDESLAYYRAAGNEARAAVVLSHMVSAQISTAAYDDAARTADECLAIFRRRHQHGNMIIALNLLGRARLGQGDNERAIALFGEALELAQGRRSLAGSAWAALNLGLAYALQEEFPASGRLYRRALEGYVTLGKRGGILAVLDGLAAVSAGTGRAAEAVHLLAATGRLRGEIGQQLSEQEETMRKRALAASRVMLAEPAWQAAWQHGMTLSLEQAVELAGISHLDYLSAVKINSVLSDMAGSSV